MLGKNPIKRKALHPINFEGALNRAVEQIQKEGLQYRTVQIKVFENCDVRPPQLDPANNTTGHGKATDMDTRLLGYIKEFAVAQDEVYLGDGKQHLVDIPKKTVLVVVSVPLKEQLEKEGLVVTQQE